MMLANGNVTKKLKRKKLENKKGKKFLRWLTSRSNETLLQIATQKPVEEHK